MIMTTTEMTKVMLAYERGEQIEWRIKNGDRGWEKQRKPPIWDWNNFEYRVKKQPSYRPYKNAQEFLKAQLVHGRYLREKVSQGLVIPLGVNDYRVILPDNGQPLTTKDFLYENLLKDFDWQDGTPCGVKEE